MFVNNTLQWRSLSSRQVYICCYCAVVMSHLDRVTGQEDGVTLVHSPLSQQPAPSLQPSVYIQPAQASVKQPPASSCSRQYCLNGGTCVQLASGIKCSCQYHFSGSRCQGTVHVKLTRGVHCVYIAAYNSTVNSQPKLLHFSYLVKE